MQAIVLEKLHLRRRFEPGHVFTGSKHIIWKFPERWRHLEFFLNIHCFIKQLAENVLSVCLCLAGLFDFIEV